MSLGRPNLLSVIAVAAMMKRGGLFRHTLRIAHPIMKSSGKVPAAWISLSLCGFLAFGMIRIFGAIVVPCVELGSSRGVEL